MRLWSKAFMSSSHKGLALTFGSSSNIVLESFSPLEYGCRSCGSVAEGQPHVVTTSPSRGVTPSLPLGRLLWVLLGWLLLLSSLLSLASLRLLSRLGYQKLRSTNADMLLLVATTPWFSHASCFQMYSGEQQ
ncbi:hypothetical protein ACH5RR_040879 [Cinchona calisaya]|uniref:Uncharacterized protein n=1 Tax=Cinchona calisaya TaxID=153742 RepID=A0ABD2XSJ5_9GENT